jgi:hypothetical protein
MVLRTYFSSFFKVVLRGLKNNKINQKILLMFGDHAMDQNYKH